MAVSTVPDRHLGTPGLPAILVLALLTAIAPLATDMYLPAFPTLAGELSASASSVQLTLTTFLVGLAVGQLVVGPLSDRWGRRRLLLGGAVVCALAGAACAVAPNVEVLTTLRFVQGFSGAAGIVLSRAVIADRSHGTTAARLFGIMMIIQGVAPVVAPLLGGGLVGAIGWRGVFWVLAALTTVMVVGVLLAVPESLPASARQSGGLAELGRNARSVLSNRRYLGYTLGFALSFTTMFAYISASPFVLQNVLGLTMLQYSVAFAINAGGLVAASSTSTALLGRFGPERLLRAGMTVMVVASGLLFLVVLAGVPMWPTLILLFVVVSSLGFIMGNATSLAAAEVPGAIGTGSAVLGALQFGLGAVASPLVGLAGENDAMPMAVTMLVVALGAALALLTMTRQRRVSEEHPGPSRRTESAAPAASATPPRQ